MEELRLQVLLEPERSGDSVAEVCRRHGISRQTFYLYRRRYLAEGPAGLEPRSRRPRCSPAQLAPEREAEICLLRKDHPRWGARRIRAELRRAGADPPAVSTIHEALKRNHLVAPQPPRRKKASKRFERELPNDLWQIDATQVPVAGGPPAWVVDIVDDHARYLLAALACPSPSGDAAWACFVAASADYGLPRQLLSDNHLSFTGRLFGLTVDFERKLANLGVQLINAAPAHPQTLGKLERLHRTLKEWLADEGPAADLTRLQQLLDRFRSHYNEQRPHQAIADATPAERYFGNGSSQERAPAGSQLTSGEPESNPVYPPHSIIRKVNRNGIVSYDGLAIILPYRYRGASVRVLPVGNLIHIYHGHELVRVLVPDRSRHYQPLHKQRQKKP